MNDFTIDELKAMMYSITNTLTYTPLSADDRGHLIDVYHKCSNAIVDKVMKGGA